MVEIISQKDVIDMHEDLNNDIKGEEYSESQCIGNHTRGEWKFKHPPTAQRTMGLVLVFLFSSMSIGMASWQKYLANLVVTLQLFLRKFHRIICINWQLSYTRWKCGIVDLAKTKTRPWRHMYHNIRIPKFRRRHLEIPRLKTSSFYEILTLMPLIHEYQRISDENYD